MQYKKEILSERKFGSYDKHNWKKSFSSTRAATVYLILTWFAFTFYTGIVFSGVCFFQLWFCVSFGSGRK
jgi:hypothetical protein